MSEIYLSKLLKFQSKELQQNVGRIYEYPVRALTLNIFVK